MTINLWTSPEHALNYLQRADSIPHRAEGEAELLRCLPSSLSRVLDLGSGDGRLLSLVQGAYPDATAIALDFSTAMLERLKSKFAGDSKVKVVAHDMSEPLPEFGTFDAVISSFAIHHLVHERKRALYQEIYHFLKPGGVFCNLEHVASSDQSLHEQFLAMLETRPEDEDPSNKLLDVEPQLKWLRDIGFAEVDCHWKWREFALLGAVKPCQQ
ncbi:MAG TPA: class I SAM-dependent methyltransferase [Candidatus Dormibacteraeota bacterium]|nr:class I SAM-dependent methyltransferase [Candidatus Dormibacteraeota bacterium]